MRTMYLRALAMAIAASAIGQGRVFTCENSTLLYSVKEADNDPMVVYQSNNVTRVFTQNPETGQWETELQPRTQGKTCDFKVITQTVQSKCVTTSDGPDRDLNFCTGGGSQQDDLDDVVAEHLVLLACSSEESAYAKVATADGSTHFIAAYHTQAEFEASEEYDPKNMSSTIEAFKRKQTCDDDSVHSRAMPALSGTTWAIVLTLIGAVILS